MGNSHILFYSEGNKDSEPVPGTIVDISEKAGVYTSHVKRQLALPFGSPDPFQVYPYFPARLYSAKLELRIDSVKLDWIASHFACYPWSDSQTAVLSLSRVRVFIINPLFLVLTSWQT